MGNAAKSTMDKATQYNGKAHIASKIGRARYQKKRVKNIHTVNDTLPNTITSFKAGKKTMQLNPKEPPLVPLPVPSLMSFDPNQKQQHTYEAR